MDNKPLIDFLDNLATASQIQESQNSLNDRMNEFLCQFEEIKKQNAEQKRLLDSYARILQDQTALIAGINRIVNDKMSDISEAFQMLYDRLDNITVVQPETVADVTEPNPESQKSFNTQPEPQPEPELKPEPEPQPEPEPELQPEPEIEPEPVESKLEPKSQTLADSIPSEETLADKLSKTIEHNTLASTINASHIDSIQTAITIADRFRFQRELFSGNGALMSSTIDHLNTLSTMAEAENYIREKFNWNIENQAVADFYAIINRKYC